jgi:glycosyltransferase involved in cell wall biosynthesis
MKRLLLVQPSLQPPGGGNGVAAWVLEALKSEYATSVLSLDPIDLHAINRFYGTALHPSEFTAVRAYPTLRPALNSFPTPLSLLKASMLLRRCKQIAGDFDLLIGVNNEMDFGRPGIQYIHFPWAYFPRPPVELRWYHSSAALVKLYYRLCTRIADFDFERMKKNLTLVNSDWTGAKMRERHGIESVTLYPAAAATFPDVPWVDRESGFVCVGRWLPEKELDKVIDIVAALRAHGQDVHLHLVGSVDDPHYIRRLRRRAYDHATWLFLEENLPRPALLRLVAAHRYGIHGMTEEHFGMAVAEMIGAGCIVFVPPGGGQQEIVNRDARLTYSTREEAVAKIVTVIEDSDVQQTMRHDLARQRDRFSTAHFVQRLRQIVKDALQGEQ